MAPDHRYWTHLVFGGGAARMEVKQWTVIATKTQPTIPAPQNILTPHRDPRFVNVLGTTQHVLQHFSFAPGESFLGLLMGKMPEIFGIGAVGVGGEVVGIFSTGAMRARVVQHSYATATEAYKNRCMEKVLVLDILQQPFKSFKVRKKQRGEYALKLYFYLFYSNTHTITLTT